MPVSPRTVCAVARCPGTAVDRGRCAMHRQTTTARGYGSAHQRDRATYLPGAVCENCGCRGNLQRDHRVPLSLGGREVPTNKRWLCRCPEHGCHDRVGLRRDRTDRPVENERDHAPSLTRAPKSRVSQNPSPRWDP